MAAFTAALLALLLPSLLTVYDVVVKHGGTVVKAVRLMVMRREPEAEAEAAEAAEAIVSQVMTIVSQKSAGSERREAMGISKEDI